MEEFISLATKGSKRKSVQSLETVIQFISDEEVLNCVAYKNPPTLTKEVKRLKLSQKVHVPGENYFKPIRQRSKLKPSQKRDCFKALKIIQTGKEYESFTAQEKQYVNFYRELQPDIALENKAYLERVKDMWENKRKLAPKSRKLLLNFANWHWTANIKKVKKYPQFYKSFQDVSLHFDENQDCINFQHSSNILELGSVAKFMKPSLVRQYQIKNETYPENCDNSDFDFTLPVSQDRNIKKLLENNRIDVVISSSGLKRIADTDSGHSWLIPVKVEECDFIDGDETFKRKVVFIDKVLPKISPTNLNFELFTFKRLVRTNLCNRYAFDYATPDAASEINANEDEVELITDAEAPKFSGNNKIYQNAIYRTWLVSKTTVSNSVLIKDKHEDFEIKLLVRSRLDACEMTGQGKLQPVIVKPKIEQQIQYGANIATKSELQREWIDLFFRPFSVLYRARISKFLPEIIAIEHCSMPKIANQGLAHHNTKLILGLGILQKVFQTLTNFEPGNYLIQYRPKNQGFVSILKSCDKTDSSLDLHETYSAAKPDQKTPPKWVPLDPTYILPAHDAQAQLPCTFYAFPQSASK